MNKQEIEKKINQLMDRYFDLVWYARKDKTDPNHPARADIERIRRQLRNQVVALGGPKGDWHHGFNSGCLATLRLISGLLGNAEEAQQSEDEFPCLDT